MWSDSNICEQRICEKLAWYWRSLQNKIKKQNNQHAIVAYLGAACPELQHVQRDYKVWCFHNAPPQVQEFARMMHRTQENILYI